MKSVKKILKTKASRKKFMAPTPEKNRRRALRAFIEPNDYTRGLSHGLQAAAAVAANHNGGKGFTQGEIRDAILKLANDPRGACLAIGDALVDGVVPHTTDVLELHKRYKV